MRKLLAATLLALTLCITAKANFTYSFKHIVEPGDGPVELANGAIGEAQLFVTVSDPGSSQALFTFTNTGPSACSITDIYFDDGALLGIASIDDSCPGVLFSQFAIPKDLPGRNNVSPPFETTEGFSADSDSPVQPNGVNPNEWLGITFNLQPLKAFDDVISDLASGELRIGIKIQGFANGGSESFVNNGIIPAPGALLLGSIGVTLVGWMRRYKRL